MGLIILLLTVAAYAGIEIGYRIADWWGLIG